MNNEKIFGNPFGKKLPEGERKMVENTCSQCGKSLGNVESATGIASHGYCSECALEFRKKYNLPLEGEVPDPGEPEENDKERE